MTSEKPRPASEIKSAKPKSATNPEAQPGWADGLRKLYDSVVDEPLPEAFKDLLSKLDDNSGRDKA